MAEVDVVVVAYNSRDSLRSCVAPLTGNGWIAPIVVDNASPDNSFEAVADLPVTIVRESENRGFAAGCNAGWRRGSAPFVLFLNPDACIDPAALRALTNVLAADDRLGAVGPTIRDGDGVLDFSIRRFPRLRSTYAQALFLHRLAPNADWADEVVRDAERYDRAGAVDWLSGACLLVRRDVLERLDGFDEGFFMYCEDIDICRRIRNLGFDVRYEPVATVLHAGGASAPRSSLVPVLAASRIRYARKHRSWVSAELERAGVALSELTHAVVGRGDRKTRAGHARAFARALTTRVRAETHT